MAAAYTLPTEVKLAFARDDTEHNPFAAHPGFTTQVQARWQRAFRFWDMGFSDGLFIAWGAQTGELEASDLMLEAAYTHTLGSDSARPTGNSNHLWLPVDLTPVNAGALVTTTIDIYFCTGGVSGGGPAFSFECVARPERLENRSLQPGLAATRVIWRWIIRDDNQPDLGT